MKPGRNVGGAVAEVADRFGRQKAHRLQVLLYVAEQVVRRSVRIVMRGEQHHRFPLLTASKNSHRPTVQKMPKPT